MPAEKRELVLDLLARNKMGQATEAAARDVDKLGTAAEKANKSTDQLGKTSAQTERKTESFGRSATDVKDKVDKLSDEIQEAERSLVELAAAFAVAETKAERVDLSKGIRKTQSEIRNLSKNKNILEGILPDPEPAGKSWASSLTSSISSSLRSMGGNPALIGSLAGLGVLLAPTIGAAVAGAVIGGVGGAGIIGGLALVAKDPTIKSMGTQIGHTFMSGVQNEAKEAFLGPAKQSLGQLSALVDRTVPKIGKIFDNVAPSLTGFTGALGRGIDKITDSLVTVSSKSGPVMDALGRMVETTAGSVADFFTMLSEHSEEGASALDDISKAISGVISVVGGLVDAAATVKSWSDSIDDAIDKGRYWLEDQSGIIDLTADGYKKGSEAAELYRKGIIGAAGSSNDYAHYVEAAKAKTDEMTGALTNAEKAARGDRDAMKALSDELKAQSDPVFGLIDAQDKLAEAQKASAEATAKHGADSKEAEKANRDLAKAAIDLEGKVGALGDAFNGEMSPALINTLRAAGLTEQQIANLARQFRGAKRDGDRFAKTYRAKVITEYITKYTTITSSAAESAYERTKRQIAGRRATGGPVEKDRPYWVGENGPELMIPERNGRVLSATQSRQAVQGARTGTASSSSVVQIELAGESEIVAFVRRLIRTHNLLQG